MPVSDNARPNDPTALCRIAGRFAGRFASADQPRGIRAAASVPRLAELRQELDVPQLVLPALVGARARGFPAQPSSAHGAMFLLPLKCSADSNAKRPREGGRHRVALLALF